MFTGIVEETGEVLAVADETGGRRLRIGCPFDDLGHGQSISVSGVCLTVEDHGRRGDGAGSDRWFEAFLAEETVAKSYLGDVAAGDRVNLERAMRADDRFDGHLVQGHVDGTTTVTGIERVGDDWRFEFALPEAFERYVVQKGSIALDGISLTVAERDGDGFAVAIVPATYDLTALSEKEVGVPVHLEVDVVAKYVESMVAGYADALGGERD